MVIIARGRHRRPVSFDRVVVRVLALANAVVWAWIWGPEVTRFAGHLAAIVFG